MGITKRIIIVASENVQDNFKLQLFDERKLKLINGIWNIKSCTGNKLLKEINPVNMVGMSKDKIISQIKNLINTISLDKLILKYNFVFDTLVLDCEGAFYYILMDMPEILTNVKLIIMENDYCDISKKNYIDDILKQNEFYVDYVEAGGWGPCQNNFFEVWKK
jgi:hypothetical protein